MANILIDLINIKDKLENFITVNDNEDDNEIIEIYKLIEFYIDKNCTHNIVTDYIDITPEYSKQIDYCDICMKTFN
jgi:hypothetical protein